MLRGLVLEELSGLLLRVLRAQGLLEVLLMRVLLVQKLRGVLVLQALSAQELLEVLELRVLSVQELLEVLPLRDPLLRCRLELLLAPREPQLRVVVVRLVAKQTAASEIEAALHRRTATTSTSLGTESPHMRAPSPSWGRRRRYCGSKYSRPQWCHTSFSSVPRRCRKGGTPPRNACRPPLHTTAAPRGHPWAFARRPARAGEGGILS